VRRGCVWLTAVAASAEATRQRREVRSREFKASPWGPEKGISAAARAEVLAVGGGILEQFGAVCPAKSAGSGGVTTKVILKND
jgi:hypothetical protein